MSTLYLTKNGCPEVTVCLLRETAAQIEQAAIEFVKAVKLISSATITTVCDGMEAANGKTIIYLSTFSEKPELKKWFLEDYEYLLDSDGFAVRRKGEKIYIFCFFPDKIYGIMIIVYVYSFNEQKGEPPS